MTEGLSLVRRHWQGHYSPLVSLFGILIGLSIALSLLWRLLLNSNYVSNSYPLQLGLVTVSIVSALPIAAWQIVGTWRAWNPANARSSGARVLSIGVRAALLIAGSWSGLQLFRSTQDVVYLYRDLLTAPNRYAIAQDARSPTAISITGDMAWGAADALRLQLKSHPEVTWLELDSQGGSFAEAKKIAELIDEFRLSTIVRTKCISACTFVYVTGIRRLASKRAKFGFHKPFGTFLTSKKQVDRDASAYRTHLLEKGVHPRFVEQAVKIEAPQYWVPDEHDLRVGGYVHEFVN